MAGGTLVAASDKTVVALDTSRGRQRWAYPIPGEQTFYGIVLHAAADRVYLQLGEAIHALSLKTGRRQWRLKLQQPNDISPDISYVSLHLLGSRLIHVGHQLDAVITALDAGGRQVWRTSFELPDGPWGVAPGVVWGSVLYVPVYGRYVHAVTVHGQNRRLPAAP
jgi:outer membrane protein assembly factor BamB